ncbi:BgTH12-04127 [Blumeria graminis f. sp. triticale]|nr:BgTH12-04127 [Blumeria graminis f. sp. triticale]
MVGKKKRNHPDIEELLARPWCYYCERDFDDLKILISHQKAKHFKCERCGRRLNTAGGLSVHMNQVHKETLTNVDNSLPNRQGLENEIFGMEGIPEDIVQAHSQRIIAVYYQAEAERRAVTGNPGPGGAASASGQPKKPKLESPAELKKRLAEHKARKAEQAASGASNIGGNLEQNSPMSTFNPPPAQSQAGFSGQQSSNFGPFPSESFVPPTASYQPQFSQQPTFSGPPGASYQPQYSPPQQYSTQQPFTSSFSPAQTYPTAPQFSGAVSSSNTFNSYQSPSLQSAPQHGGLPSRPPSLPLAPGLPQRPSFGAPAVPSYQMQQLHQGPPQGGWSGNGWKGQDQKLSIPSTYHSHSQGYVGDLSTNASSLEDLVSCAAREADDIDHMIRMAEAGIKPSKVLETAPTEPAQNNVEDHHKELPEAVEKTDSENKNETIDKKQKKEKPIKMIYSDNILSPEERMAKMPRYAFVPDEKTKSSSFDTAMVPVDTTTGAAPEI